MVNITVQVLDLSTGNPINNLTQQRFSAPFLTNFQNKGNGLYAMDIKLATAGPKRGTAELQVCAPGFLCKTQTVEVPDPPGEIFIFRLPESPPLSALMGAVDGAGVRVRNGNDTLSDSITFNVTTSGGQPPYSYIYTFDAQPFGPTSSSQETYGSIIPGTHRMVVLATDANGIETTARDGLDPSKSTFTWTFVPQ